MWCLPLVCWSKKRMDKKITNQFWAIDVFSLSTELQALQHVDYLVLCNHFSMRSSLHYYFSQWPCWFSKSVNLLNASASILVWPCTYSIVGLNSSIFCFQQKTQSLVLLLAKRILWSVKIVILVPRRKFLYSFNTSNIASISCSMVEYLLWVGVNFMEK